MMQPRLRFAATADPHGRQPATRPAALPGAISRWAILQWKKRELLGPAARREPLAEDGDALLGPPTVIFETPSKTSRLKVFARAHPPVYELYSEGGDLDAEGGANLFLSARVGRRLSTFDRPITYEVTLRLSEAHASASQPRLHRDGSVLAQVLSGFVLEFRTPGAAHPTTLFLQIRHADSRGRQPDYRHCRFRRDGSAIAIFSGVLPGDGDLPFKPGMTPERFRFRLDAYLRLALSAPFPSDDPARPWVPPLKTADLALWKVREMYIGLETQDGRRGSSVKAGTVAAALQVSGLAVYRDR